MDMNTTIWQSKTPPSANPLNPLPTNRRPSLTFRQPSSVLKIQAKCDLNCQLVGRTDLSRHKNYHLDMACFYPKKNPYIDLLSLRPFSTISRLSQTLWDNSGSSPMANGGRCDLGQLLSQNFETLNQIMPPDRHLGNTRVRTQAYGRGSGRVRRASDMRGSQRLCKYLNITSSHPGQRKSCCHHLFDSTVFADLFIIHHGISSKETQDVEHFSSVQA